jgi:hypothetical protein
MLTHWNPQGQPALDRLAARLTAEGWQLIKQIRDQGATLRATFTHPAKPGERMVVKPTHAAMATWMHYTSPKARGLGWHNSGHEG